MNKLNAEQIKTLAEKVCLMIDNSSDKLSCKYNNDNYHYQTVKYGDVCFAISFNEYKQRIYVNAVRLRSSRDDWYWSYNITTIGMSLNKGVTAIVKDIERRFLPDFFLQSDVVLQSRADHYKYLDEQDTVKQTVCAAFDMVAEKNRDRDIYGKIGDCELKATINKETFDLKISGLKPEQAAKIAAVLGT